MRWANERWSMLCIAAQSSLWFFSFSTYCPSRCACCVCLYSSYIDLMVLADANVYTHSHSHTQTHTPVLFLSVCLCLSHTPTRFALRRLTRCRCVQHAANASTRKMYVYFVYQSFCCCSFACCFVCSLFARCMVFSHSLALRLFCSVGGYFAPSHEGKNLKKRKISYAEQPA